MNGLVREMGQRVWRPAHPATHAADGRTRTVRARVSHAELAPFMPPGDAVQHVAYAADACTAGLRVGQVRCLWCGDGSYEVVFTAKNR